MPATLSKSDCGVLDISYLHNRAKRRRHLDQRAGAESGSITVDLNQPRNLRQGAIESVLSRDLEISAKRRQAYGVRINEQKQSEVSSGPSSPKWLLPALESAYNLLTLPLNWDSYGAPPIMKDTIMTGIEVLVNHSFPGSPAPVFVPTSRGGCQLEWHTSRFDLEIEVMPGGEVSVFYFDRRLGAQGEGDLKTNAERVRAILRELA